MAKQREVRLGVIGLGNMGSDHVRKIQGGQVPGLRVTAVCDALADNLKQFPDLVHFDDHKKLIASGEVDAVLIATPHYFHTTQGIDALKGGMHVLVEKPISVHKADCERLIKAYKERPNKRQIFAAMFNQRTDPRYRKIKELIETGELGAITRVNWIITTWFRSDAYYASGGWRATWGGEGGGVLLNQCPHQLDLLQWLTGMPNSVRAWCRLGQWHDIEVEDDVTAYLQYPNGASGVFITTTGEAPGTNRLEIVGDRGKLVAEGDGIQFTRNEIPTATWNRTTDQRFGTPPVWNIDIPTRGSGAQHVGIMKNFANAILHREKLIAPAEEGIRSVELANAMLHSSFLGKDVELPLSGAAYERKLKQLIKDSKPKKKKAKAKAKKKASADDFAASF